MNTVHLRLPSPALIVACLALFVALGGATYAATSAGPATLHFINVRKFTNGWRPTPSQAYARPGYARSGGVVHLRGVIYAGIANRTAFVLPRSARPDHLVYLQVFTRNGATGSVLIQHDGEVIPFGKHVTGLTSLDGISFAAGE